MEESLQHDLRKVGHGLRDNLKKVCLNLRDLNLCCPNSDFIRIFLEYMLNILWHHCTPFFFVNAGECIYANRVSPPARWYAWPPSGHPGKLLYCRTDCYSDRRAPDPPLFVRFSDITVANAQYNPKTTMTRESIIYCQLWLWLRPAKCDFTVTLEVFNLKEGENAEKAENGSIPWQCTAIYIIQKP